MEGLIELITGNPLLLLMILFGLISLFGRMGGGNNQQEQRQPQPRRQQSETHSDGRGEVDWKEIFRQEEAPPIERQPQAEAQRYEAPSSAPSHSQYSADEQSAEASSKMNDVLHERYEQLRKRKKEANKKAAKLDADSPLLKNEISPEQEKVSLDFSSVSREDIVKGVVWSEILGPPKSRKNRQSGGYTRRQG
ncbi:hypothetical protein [Alteribacter populi]|uniref:hypothetical protein n=1 Tax=Alteribacter populi TaxID=2011011 RepID=UPI000BBAD9C6|nr:hypothetical protein [Alteribacter populi]